MDKEGFRDIKKTWLANLEILGPAKLQLPPLPRDAYWREHFPTLIFTNDQQLMFLTWQTCWVLKNQNNKLQWVEHSRTNITRKHGLVVKMSTGIYVFGGENLLGLDTSEFLPNGATKWVDGPKLPEELIGATCALAISSNELLMVVKDFDLPSLIMKLNVETEEWSDLLALPGKVHTMAIFNDKVIIVHGAAQTAILPMRRSKTPTNQLEAHLEQPRIGGDLNCKERVCQKMGIVCLRGNPKLVIFGTSGKFKDGWDQKMPVEVWDDDLEQWEISTDLEFPSCRRGFALCYDSM